MTPLAIGPATFLLPVDEAQVSLKFNKNNFFPFSGYKAGNVPNHSDYIKKIFYRVAGHRDDVKIVR